MDDRNGHLSPKLIELHGNAHLLRCPCCRCYTDLTPFEISLRLGLPIPCLNCQETSDLREASGRRALSIGNMQPGISLYDDPRTDSETIWSVLEQDTRPRHVNLWIVAGTSLKTNGIQEVAKYIKKRCPKADIIYMNLDPPPPQFVQLFSYHIVGTLGDATHYFRMLLAAASVA